MCKRIRQLVSKMFVRRNEQAQGLTLDLYATRLHVIWAVHLLADVEWLAAGARSWRAFV
jgi:hypothetical protein